MSIFDIDIHIEDTNVPPAKRCPFDRIYCDITVKLRNHYRNTVCIDFPDKTIRNEPERLAAKLFESFNEKTLANAIRSSLESRGFVKQPEMKMERKPITLSESMRKCLSDDELAKIDRLESAVNSIIGKPNDRSEN